MLTVPASFDAGARELTVEAAAAAGIENLTLLEEPQAALYAWIDAHGEGWRKEIRVGDVILVVDVGGGTTDFSAIAAVDREGTLELARVAVGDHILLGGDNMDLALAHVARAKLEEQGKEVDRWQMVALTFACRAAKEALFSQPAMTSHPIAIAARGSKLLGGGLRTELTREDLARVLLDGYFPVVAASARPESRPRSGLVQAGLPYAQDPAVTRHLAAFLARQADAVARIDGVGGAACSKSVGALLHPTAIVFNGGVMKADALRNRVVTTLDAWLAAEDAPPVRVLEGSDLDLAVARGAVAYGLVRHGRGLRIRGGTAQCTTSASRARRPPCPGSSLRSPRSAWPRSAWRRGPRRRSPPRSCASWSARRCASGSSGRAFDAVTWRGPSCIDGPRTSSRNAPIEVTLPAEGRSEGDVVPVHLRAAVTEVGTLLLEAVPTAPKAPDERWKMSSACAARAERNGATLHLCYASKWVCTPTRCAGSARRSLPPWSRFSARLSSRGARGRNGRRPRSCPPPR